MHSHSTGTKSLLLLLQLLLQLIDSPSPINTHAVQLICRLVCTTAARNNHR